MTEQSKGASIQLSAEEGRLCDLADKVELAMETRPVGFGWTPSAVARKAKITTTEAHQALAYMVEHVYVTTDDRGAWSKYFRRH